MLKSPGVSVTTPAGGGLSHFFNPPMKTSWVKRVKSQIPVYTSGLETKLTKGLGQDATPVIAFLERKFGKPQITKSYSRDTYVFSRTLTYVDSPGLQHIQYTTGMLDVMQSPMIYHNNRRIAIQLELTSDGKLFSFDFKMGASKT